MSNKSTTPQSKDHWHIAVVFLGIGLLVFLGVQTQNELLVENSSYQAAEATVDTTTITPEEKTESKPEQASVDDSDAQPVQLRIPRLNIVSDFHAPLSLQPNGEVEVPETYNEVGWYQHLSLIHI